MIAGIRLKICGLRTLVDADAADAIGADFLGFNLWPGSPRFIALAQWQAMVLRLPARKKVAVSVAPTISELRSWRDSGFDAFQIHFPPETSEDEIAGWSAAVGRERLWLAPRLPSGVSMPEAALAHADTLLLDTYLKDSFGGTGLTGDWRGFAAAGNRHPGKTWILAGGLSPDNIAEALAVSGARFVDVNSGVEAAPGIKDPAKLGALRKAIEGARTAPGRPV